jgi:hypothetical protein
MATPAAVGTLRLGTGMDTAVNAQRAVSAIVAVASSRSTRVRDSIGR